MACTACVARKQRMHKKHIRRLFRRPGIVVSDVSAAHRVIAPPSNRRQMVPPTENLFDAFAFALKYFCFPSTAESQL